MFVAEVPIVVKNFRNTFRKILNSSWELIMFIYFLAVYDKTVLRKTWSNYLISDDGDTAVFSVKNLHKMNLEMEDLL
jgi:hypothetical protein